MTRVILLLLPLLSAVADSSVGQYSGAEACRPCHPTQYSQQSETGHALTLHRAAEHPLADRVFPEAALRDGQFTYLFRRTPGSIVVQVVSQDAGWELPVEWAFGSGEQAITFVTRLGAEFYVEHRLSYYSRPPGLGVTPGQHFKPPRTLVEAIGVRNPIEGEKEGMRRCFGCHSTGPVSLTDGGGFVVREHGVKCEACHGPGAAHIPVAATSNSGEARRTIDNPGRKSSAALNRMCGVCHRPPPAAGAHVDWSDAWNVRHQPVYFSQSRCMKEGGLTCLQCHSPHRPLARNMPDTYNRVCRSCHEATRHRGVEVGHVGNCIGCHMPKVTAMSNLHFSNHWIGIYSDQSLRPVQ